MNRAQARRLARWAKSFILIDNELHKRSPSGVLQRCIPIPEGKELIRDIHAGICGHHAVLRTLVGNAFRQGFYWPTAVADATDVVRTYEGCQFYARKIHLSTHALQTCEGCHHVAVCRVGIGPRWPAAKGARGLHPFVGGNRQILQVGRSSTRQQD